MASVAQRLPEPAAQTRKFSFGITACFAALIIAGNFSILQRLVMQWLIDGDMGHGLFVPVVAAYIVWGRRETLAALRPQPSWWGVAAILWGLAQGYLGTLGADLFLQRTSVLITLFGLLLAAGGAPLIRALAFPLLLLLFMIPLPGVVYN